MSRLLYVACFFIPVVSLCAADPTPEQRQFQDFVRRYAAQMRAADRVPTSKEEWLLQRDRIRRGLEDAWNFPEETCPLEPRKLGEVQRDGYRMEKLIFQTMPGVWMTAFAYVPEGTGPFPAILQVHGHWKGAKQDPVVQARCIGAAKLGFFVLAVDAFGAGERGLTKNLGEYHGEMVGATLFPIGRPLSGIQVYENRRAVEYLQTRPEVHREKIGITGASGGGNQSMYAGCYDDRFAAVVPCCSVGTYDAYLTTACCMCEVVPSALTFTEEWGILGLAAPRGLMVINASKDAFQFSIGEARKSLGKVDGVFALWGRPENLRHNTYFWHHDYSRSMREAMYGWMAYHLQGTGDGSPIPEPALETFDPEEIRCFPHGSRPDDWLTLPQFAAREGRQILAKWTWPASKGDWEKRSAELRQTLVDKTFGGFPEISALDLHLVHEADSITQLRFTPEPGISLLARWIHPTANPEQTTIVLDLNGAEAAETGSILQSLRNDKTNYVVVDLRATGRSAWPADRILRATDHNTAQWAMWIGRPLLGQWTFDVLRLIDALEESKAAGLGEIALACQGPAGIVGLCAAAVDPRSRIRHVHSDGMLVSYLSDVPFEGQRVGILAPGIVRDVGDVPHLVALALNSARVTISNGTTPDGKFLGQEELERAFATATALARLSGRLDDLQIRSESAR